MAYLYVFLAQVIGSSTHLIAQTASHSVPPGVVLLFRASGASLLFLPILFATERRWDLFSRIERADWGRVFLIGMLNIPINQLLYLNGVKYTTPANSALLYAMTPAMVFVLTLLLHSERPTGRKIVGILMALAGASIIMFERGAALESEHTLGNILIFVAVIAWSLFTMLGRPLVLKYGAVYITGVNMIIGTLLYLPFGLLTTSWSDVTAISSDSWLEIAYLAAIASVLNYILWYTALAKLETTKAAIFQNLQPVMTTALAMHYGKVILTEQLVGGGVLTLIGVLVVQFG